MNKGRVNEITALANIYNQAVGQLEKRLVFREGLMNKQGRTNTFRLFATGISLGLVALGTGAASIYSYDALVDIINEKEAKLVSQKAMSMENIIKFWQEVGNEGFKAVYNGRMFSWQNVKNANAGPKPEFYRKFFK